MTTKVCASCGDTFVRKGARRYCAKPECSGRAAQKKRFLAKQEALAKEDKEHLKKVRGSWL